ncbi:DsbA family protein [Kordiimonas aestuarii]|uniref:DsbA family protein n=1 Tax=Kordiimonas aestuarii TaxID=1005925 RepID=UPI0021D12A05|nr:DsbA family protein [Kordiimonas aestuarii]
MVKKLILAAALTATASPALMAQPQDIDPVERKKIESVVQDYLMEHPEVIMQAVGELQRRQTLAQMLPAIEMYRSYLEEDAGAAVLGNPNGDVTIVEFFDYRCGYCRRHFPDVMKLVEGDGNIRLLPKQFPILDSPDAKPLSLLTAKAALAAQKQGKFAAFHKAMMTSGAQVTEESIYQVASSVGLDVAMLKADMADKLIEKRIKNTLAIGQDIGFSGTPGYIIGKDVVLGAEGYGRLKQAVDRARAEMGK